MSAIFLVFLAIIALIILLWQVSNIISVLSGSPYVMADKKIVRESLKAVGLKKGDIFYDLGCGKGDVLIEAEKMGAKAIGYEISPYYYIWAKIRTSPKPNIEVRFKNILHVDLSDADIVYCYLLPEFLKKLSPQFQKKLKPGSRLISIGFPIKKSSNFAGAKIRDKYIFKNHKIYIYKF